VLTATSDGKTPDEVVKQILQIHAILPGQKPDRQFNIPSRTNEQPPPQPKEAVQSMEQVPVEQSAQPTETLQPASSGPTGMQSQPVGMSQHHQQNVGLPSNFDGIPTHAPLSKNSSLSNDSSHPPTLPLEQPNSQPSAISPEYREIIAKELPPSKLLNSNPEPEPRRDDLLRRTDSETQEDDEFHDAHS
jgi:hypothetical protein